MCKKQISLQKKLYSKENILHETCSEITYKHRPEGLFRGF